MRQDERETDTECAYYREKIKQMMDQIFAPGVLERIYYYVLDMMKWEKDKG